MFFDKSSIARLWYILFQPFILYSMIFGKVMPANRLIVVASYRNFGQMYLKKIESGLINTRTEETASAKYNAGFSGKHVVWRAFSLLKTK